MAIAWDPTLAIGVGEIDRQHQELFRRLDALLEAAQSGRSAAEVGRLLDFLAAYVREHFAAEEALMRTRAYPGRAAHEEEHRAFVDDLAALRREHEAEGATALLVVKVNARVARWLAEHIWRTDRALGLFLLHRAEVRG